MIGMRALLLGVVVAVMSAWVSPASAAFPGSDGDLVVATGTGLELVAPGTGAASSICTSVVLCGHPAQPSFSPNGQAIAFVDATSDRPVVVAADGSCLWCLLGARLTSLTGSEAAFTPGGRGGDGRWEWFAEDQPQWRGCPRARQGARGRRCLVVGWARCAGAPGLDLRRTT